MRFIKEQNTMEQFATFPQNNKKIKTYIAEILKDKAKFNLCSQDGQNILHFLSRYHSSYLEKILESKFITIDLLNKKDNKGNTCLHILSIYNSQLINLFFKHRLFNPDMLTTKNNDDDDCFDLIFCKSKVLNKNTMYYLVNSEYLDFNRTFDNGNTLIHMIVKKDPIMYVRYFSHHTLLTNELFNKTNDLGQTIFHILCSKKNIKIEHFKQFVRCKFFTKSFFERRDNNGWTGIHYLCFNNVQVTEHLIGLTTDIIFKKNKKEYKRTIKLLSNNDINCITKNKESCLHLIAKRNPEYLVKFIDIFKNYINKNIFYIQDLRNNTFLHYICLFRPKLLNTILYQDYVDYDLLKLQNINSDTVFTILLNNPRFLRLLLGCPKFNKTLFNHEINNSTCLHIIARKYPSYIKLLLNSQYSDNNILIKQNNQGHTFLHIIALYNPSHINDCIINDELEKIRDNNDKTFLDYLSRHKEIYNNFVKH